MQRVNGWFAGMCLALVACGWVAPEAWAGDAEPGQVEDQLQRVPGDWPWWRGPARNGTAEADQDPPLRWSEAEDGKSENVVWSVPVPGRSHGSPTVVGNHVLLAIADQEREVQAVACYDRATGERLWETVVHRGQLTVLNEKSCAASCSIACLSDRLFVTFLNGDTVYTTCLDRQGKQLWQATIGDYIIHQGYGASPLLYRSLVIIASDHKGGGEIVALDQKTGAEVWRRERPKTPNYPSPIAVRVAGKDQVILTGCDRITSYEPLTGRTLWEMDGATTECVTSTLTDGTHIFTSGGYPRNHLSAIVADGSKKVAWENEQRVYVPSMLVRDGFLYATLDAGVAMCWESNTGKERWKARLGGTFSSSPVLVGDRIYATNEAGETFVYRADPEKYELLAKNKLGDEVFATPAICGGRIYQRVAKLVDGERQEFLYCLGSAQ
jgi:outer membrane protein assembly factor BamB